MTRSRDRLGDLLIVAIMVLAVVVAVVRWWRDRSTSPAPTAGTPAGSAVVAPSTTQPARPPPRVLPSRRPTPGAGAASNPLQRPLVGLFDTDALCEQHNATHCAALRDAAARCDRKEIAGCQAVLALVDAGPLRDLSLARVFAQRLCTAGGDCARSRDLERFRQGRTDPDARRAAIAACTGGDPIACAFAHEATGDGDGEAEEKARYADLACRGGVIAAGGCFAVSLGAMGSPAARAALAHACTSGSADGCDLLGLHDAAKGDLAAARIAFARGCELAPGSASCNALAALDRGDPPDER